MTQCSECRDPSLQEVVAGVRLTEEEEKEEGEEEEEEKD